MEQSVISINDNRVFTDSGLDSAFIDCQKLSTRKNSQAQNACSDFSSPKL